MGGRPRERRARAAARPARLPRRAATSSEQPQLVLVVDHDGRARRDAELEQRARLHRRRHDDVGGRNAAIEHLLQLALARDVDPEPVADGLVDERERLVGLAGEEDPEVDAEVVGAACSSAALRASGAGSMTLSGEP